MKKSKDKAKLVSRFDIKHYICGLTPGEQIELIEDLPMWNEKGQRVLRAAGGINQPYRKHEPMLSIDER